MIEKNVVNVELSKKLYELGIDKESLFYWYEFEGNSVVPEVRYHTLQYGHIISPYLKMRYSAYLASELLEILYSNIDVSIIEVRRGFDKIGFFVSCFSELTHTRFFDESIPNGLANILIYLLENKLMEIK